MGSIVFAGFHLSSGGPKAQGLCQEKPWKNRGLGEGSFARGGDRGDFGEAGFARGLPACGVRSSGPL
jgi:hypothetical protein